ncbi:FAD-dependent thymidylate synthase [Aneurinibacillus migulanus]|uniref:FAD-dependent thymidylate synthase n=1 Tax=Aneurinibacillus migulanus TaxID=47500 RepID=UPI002E1C33C8|nr:FAD-dependent thymidylate synthase [Aneurinibacillus migulanus]MED4729255.1 FAD-dependent thymidylate synthase [Aneurinibacillus migulanus]
MKYGMKLEKYVTSTVDNVYAFKSVPTEVVGTIFAKASLDSRGIRDHLDDIIREGVVHLPDTAYTEGFMKRGEETYDHPSVKEHAFVQFCVEGVSHWFTEILETVQAAKGLSFTEFGCYLRKPQNFIIPAELDRHPELKERYIAFGQECAERYKEFVPLFFEIIKTKNPQMEDAAIEKLACENARSVLPLAAKSNVAITGNARAISDAIVEMLAHEGYNREVAETAEKIRMHTAEVLPSLIGQLEATPYARSYVAEFYQRRIRQVATLPVYSGPFVEVSDKALALSFTRVEDMVLGDLSQISQWNELPTVMRAFGKRIAITCSEGCHHQIIRHRAFDFSLQLPDTRYGLILPREVVTVSGTAAAKRIMDVLLLMRNKSHELYDTLVQTGLIGIAPYVVLNANARRLPFYVNMYGLAHFVTLHKEEHVQDEIRSVASQLERIFREEEQALSGFKMDRRSRE